MLVGCTVVSYCVLCLCDLCCEFICGSIMCCSVGVRYLHLDHSIFVCARRETYFLITRKDDGYGEP